MKTIPKVKICGITNIDDALAACVAGADALGFVFYKKSPRYVEPKKAKEIVSKLPPFIKKVGLFVNEDPKDINKVVNESRMDISQLHFEISNDFTKELEHPYIKVIRVKSRDDILSIDKEEFVLVDAFVKSYGGEGKRIDKDWFEGIDCSKMILAGGLNEQNIKEMLRFNFYGYDVSSGVEAKKGLKDHLKMKKFVKMAKGYDN